MEKRQHSYKLTAHQVLMYIHHGPFMNYYKELITNTYSPHLQRQKMHMRD
jgi:hypothetical protein